VKDSPVPDPSLAKVVKDSTLTILFQFWGALSREEELVGDLRTLDLEEISLQRSLSSPGRLFSSVLEEFSLHIYLLLYLGEFTEGGRICDERSCGLGSDLSSTVGVSSHMS
jgi:hypothetical protein